MKKNIQCFPPVVGITFPLPLIPIPLPLPLLPLPKGVTGSGLIFFTDINVNYAEEHHTASLPNLNKFVLFTGSKHFCDVIPFQIVKPSGNSLKENKFKSCAFV